MSVDRVPLRVSHSRRSIRLRGFDYSRQGVYFVTICVKMGDLMFGRVVEGMDTVLRISKVPTTTVEQHQNVPQRPVTIESVTLKPAK